MYPNGELLYIEQFVMCRKTLEWQTETQILATDISCQQEILGDFQVWYTFRIAVGQIKCIHKNVYVMCCYMQNSTLVHISNRWLLGGVTSKTATNQNGHDQNGHRQKRPQAKTATD